MSSPLRRSAKRVYALTTFLPFAFMAVTVLTSGVLYTAGVTKGPQPDYVKAVLTIIMMALAIIGPQITASRRVGVSSSLVK